MKRKMRGLAWLLALVMLSGIFPLSALAATVTDYCRYYEGAHQYQWVTVTEPTCTSTGLRSGVCNCGMQTREVIPALGHNFQTTGSQATCTAPGEQVVSCTRCGLVQSRNSIPALGHSWGAWRQSSPATCVREAMIYRICSRCQEREWSRDYEAGLGDHDWGEWELVIEPTPDAPGLRRRVCNLSADHVEEETVEYYSPELPELPDLLAPDGTGASTDTTMPSLVPEESYEDKKEPYEPDVTLDPDLVQNTTEAVVQDTNLLVPVVEEEETKAYTGISVALLQLTPAKEYYTEGETLKFNVQVTNESSFDFTRCGFRVKVLGGEGEKTSFQMTNETGGVDPSAGSSADYPFEYTVSADDVKRGYQSISVNGVDAGVKTENGYDPLAPVVSGYVDNGMLMSSSDVIRIRIAQPEDGTAAEGKIGISLKVTQTSPEKPYYVEGDVIEFDYLLKNESSFAFTKPSLIFYYYDEKDLSSAEYYHVENAVPAGETASYHKQYTVTHADAKRGGTSLGWNACDWSVVDEEGYSPMFPVVSGYVSEDNLWVGNDGKHYEVREKEDQTVSVSLSYTVKEWPEAYPYIGVGDKVGLDMALTNEGSVPVTLLGYEIEEKTVVDEVAWTDMANTVLEPGHTVHYWYAVVITGNDVSAGMATRTIWNTFSYKGEDGSEATGETNRVNPGFDVLSLPKEPQLYLTVEIQDEKPYYYVDAYGYTECISYDLHVTNTGSEPLEIGDYKILIKGFSETGSSPHMTIYPLETKTISGVKHYHHVSEITPGTETADLLGHVNPLFTVQGFYPSSHLFACESNPAEATVRLKEQGPDPVPEEGQPSLTITKDVTSSPLDKNGYTAGEIIDYEILVENTGDEPIYDIDVRDDFYSAVHSNMVIDHIDVLYPHSSHLITYSYEVKEEDIPMRYVTNMAYADWTDPQGIPHEKPSVHVIVPLQSGGRLGIGKIVFSPPPDGREYFIEGENIVFMVMFQNLTKHDYNSVSVYDDQNVQQKGTELLENIGYFGVNGGKTYFLSYTVTDLDVKQGEVVNTAYYEGMNMETLEWETGSYTIRVPVGRIPKGSLQVTKTETSKPANGAYYTENETISYSISVSNYSGEDYNDVIIHDLLEPLPGEIASIELLHNGETRTYVYTHVVTEEDVRSVYVVNQAGATYDGRTTLSNRVKSPTSAEADGKIFLGEGKDETCIRTILSAGDYEVNYLLKTCSEHTAVQQEADKILEKAGNDEEVLAAWQEIQKLWRNALLDEYSELISLVTTEGKVLLKADQLQFFSCLDSLEKLLMESLTELEVAQKIADIEKNRVADLCYLSGHANEMRPDSLVGTMYEKITGGAYAENGFGPDYQLYGGTHWQMRLNEAFGRIHRNILTSLEQALTRNAYVKAWSEGCSLWRTHIDVRTNALYQTEDQNLRGLVAGNRIAFEQWLAAQKDLYAFFYPDHPEMAEELSATAMRNHAVVIEP